MEPSDYVRSIRSDGLALAEAGDGRLQRSVPSCPGWSVADLVWHVGAVHRFWGEIAGRELLDPNEVERVDRPDDTDLLAWYSAQLARLLGALDAADPETLVWSWASEDPVPTAWIHRRMAQETAVHRWDAQNASGERSPIEADVAVDGIEEFLFQFVGFEPASLADGGETVRFEAADTGDAWVARGRGRARRQASGACGLADPRRSRREGPGLGHPAAPLAASAARCRDRARGAGRHGSVPRACRPGVIASSDPAMTGR